MLHRAWLLVPSSIGIFACIVALSSARLGIDHMLSGVVSCLKWRNAAADNADQDQLLLVHVCFVTTYGPFESLNPTSHFPNRYSIVSVTGLHGLPSMNWRNPKIYGTLQSLVNTVRLMMMVKLSATSIPGVISWRT